jgi:hypothetical protein
MLQLPRLAELAKISDDGDENVKQQERGTNRMRVLDELVMATSRYASYCIWCIASRCMLLLCNDCVHCEDGSMFIFETWLRTVGSDTTQDVFLCPTHVLCGLCGFARMLAFIPGKIVSNFMS